jgi:hypothetical protein
MKIDCLLFYFFVSPKKLRISYELQKSISKEQLEKLNNHYYKSGVQFTSLNHYGTLKVK